MKMVNDSLDALVNERKLLKAASLNDLLQVRDLLACGTNPNAQTEV